MRVYRGIVAASATFVVLGVGGCGRAVGGEATLGEVAVPSACEGQQPPGELAVLANDSSMLEMGPCGELSYRVGEQTFLTDSSLRGPRLLEGAESEVRFDPLGRGVIYFRDQGETLVYEELRGGADWAVALPPLTDLDRLYVNPGQRARVIDFYLKGDTSGLFLCQGSTLHDYDGAGAETTQALQILCPRAMHSSLDALLVAPSAAGFVRVELDGWQTRLLERVGVCEADLCEWSLTRRVLKRQDFVNRLMGDAFWSVAADVHYFDGQSGEQVPGYRALSTPDRGVVTALGSIMYQAEDLTLAVVDDTDGSAFSNTIRYLGPAPGQPTRWLRATFELTPRRWSLRALPSDDLQHVAVWNDSCLFNQPDHENTVLSFVPGADPQPIRIAGCVLNVYWVGSDGTLLANVWLKGTVRQSGVQLALIHPDQRVTLLDIDVIAGYGSVRQVLANEHTLLVSMMNDGPLIAVDLETGRTRVVAESTGLLLSDRARQRVAFQVTSNRSSDPQPLWAGAFPSAL